MFEEHLTVEEVAAKLKVHRGSVYKWIKAGQLKAVKAGDLWRIPEGELRRFLAEGAISQETRRK